VASVAVSPPVTAAVVETIVATRTTEATSTTTFVTSFTCSTAAGPRPVTGEVTGGVTVAGPRPVTGEVTGGVTVAGPRPVTGEVTGGGVGSGSGVGAGVGAGMTTDRVSGELALFSQPAAPVNALDATEMTLLVVLLAVGVNVALYELPEPEKLDSVPPETETSEEIKSLTGSDSVNVIRAVCPLDNDDLSEVTVIVGRRAITESVFAEFWTVIFCLSASLRLESVLIAIPPPVLPLPT
jgi:hypothetical protein